jgi:Ca2+-binding RTX toxin-like protein
MGPDLEVGGIDWQGGMTYSNLENLTINLGIGNDQLEITGIQQREDFQTVTIINTGAGDDWVHFNGPQAEQSGLFALHLEQGDDRVTTENTTAPLVIFGDDGVDLIQGSDGDDIIFADFGQVDYLDSAGKLITRFGLGQRGTVNDAVIPSSDLESVPFAQTDGNFYGPSLAVSRLTDTGWNDEIRGQAGDDLLIGGVGDDDLYGEAGNDILIGDNGYADYRNGLVVKAASGDPNIGGADDMFGGTGGDLLIGGAVADQLYGEDGNDYLVGDAGRANYQAGRLQMVETIDEHRFIGGDDWLDGGAGSDAMFGGHGGDTFVGGFQADLIIGEYARLLILDGKAVSVVRLAQGNLDLISSQQFSLYNPLALTPSLAQMTSVQQQEQLRELFAVQRPAYMQVEKRTHHGSDFSVAAKDQGYGYHPPQEDLEQPDQEVPVDELEQQLPEDITPTDEQVKRPAGEGTLEPSIIDPQQREIDDLPEILEELPEEIEDGNLQAAVAAFGGWALAPSRWNKTGSTGRFEFESAKLDSWRWQDGRLRRAGWKEDKSTEEQYLNINLPAIKTEIGRSKSV